MLQTISPLFLGLGEMLALGRLLGLVVPKQTLIIAVEVQDAWSVGTRLTPVLEASLPGIVERVLAGAGLRGAPISS